MTLEQLKQWLIAAGFQTAPDPISSEYNECKWIAYRRTAARDCECNDRAPNLVVAPQYMRVHGRIIATVEITMTGQYDNWWKLQAYSISYDELPNALPAIETRLVRAWNALGEP